MRMVVAGLCMSWLLAPMAAPGQTEKPPAGTASTVADVLAAARAEDWRTPDAENTLYVELPGGRVVIELAPLFAPQHVANVKALAREYYFDGLAVLRVQDNYVVQWGDPEVDNPQKARRITNARHSLPAEFDRSIDEKIHFTPLPDGDVYAGEVGFSAGLPVARDRHSNRMWLVHCYGMAGAGRGDSRDSGSGAEMYVVIGHAPRHLDRNVTLFGKVLQGMELLSSLPRGKGPMGFIEPGQTRVPIRSIRVAADVPLAGRSDLQVLRTDTETFRKLIEARRNRSEEWFLLQAGRVELANVPVPVRKKETK
ncbi:MAG: peptidylprolyl isomerase [Candidatus Aminicenantes bacterium]|nr:peptidylprolyl isomerase [Candidatus Aminicenantes bacterium]